MKARPEESVVISVKQDVDDVRCEMCEEKGVMIVQKGFVGGEDKKRLVLICTDCGSVFVPHLSFEYIGEVEVCN